MIRNIGPQPNLANKEGAAKLAVSAAPINLQIAGLLLNAGRNMGRFDGRIFAHAEIIKIDRVIISAI